MLTLRLATAPGLLALLLAPAPLPASPPPDAPAGDAGNWIEHFDSYPVGTQLHGTGGWQGWNGDPTYGATTSAEQARSAPASVDITGSSILVHTHTGVTTGTRTFTAWLYVASPSGDRQRLLLLNTYPISFLSDWSAIVCFDAPAGVVRDDPSGLCDGPTTLPLAFDRWVEIRVEIDLESGQQAFFYDGQLLYQDSWISHVDCCGALRFAAVELSALDGFVPSSASVFYDDLSLSTLPFSDGFESGDTRAWHAAAP